MTQSQIEATIELLLLSTYADSHISIKEEEAMVNAVQQLGWHSEHPRDIFLLNSVNRVRRVAEDDGDIGAYVAERALLFPDADTQTDCVSLIRGVLQADGMAATENRFLARLVSSFTKAHS
jgi:hypothetical protein